MSAYTIRSFVEHRLASWDALRALGQDVRPLVRKAIEKSGVGTWERGVYERALEQIETEDVEP